MKKLFFGLAMGIALSGVACIIAIPKIKETSYDKGYNAGDIKGESDGTAVGISNGVAQYRQQQQHVQDSITTAEQAHIAAVLRRLHHKPHKVAKPIQNWHVIDGKIGAPIPDSSNS